jgi:transcriptional regulator with XRE-family HTH domain
MTFRSAPLGTPPRPSPLRARRLLRGLRLRDVERAIGIADTALSALERGEAKLLGTRLRRLAEFYQTPPARLADEMRAWADRPDARLRGGSPAALGTRR